MRGIIIAAGRGVRLQRYTVDLPKCMLPIAGRPILSYAIEQLRAAGCSRVVIVTGHQAHRLEAPGCVLISNDDYANNNILHSLMYARAELDDDVLVTYSDIVVEPHVYERLARAAGDIVLAVDGDWRGYYDGRTEHPIEEAEKAIVVPAGGERGTLQAIGKHLPDAAPDGALCAEFTGFWKMSRSGAMRFRSRFESLDRELEPATPFRAAREWRKAYVTDFLADLLSEGATIDCEIIARGWAEIDTVEDYERLPSKMESQGLNSFREKQVERS